MAVDDDVLHKNPFGFELAGVVVNYSVTREALTRDQMRKILKFVHDDNVYCKYYEVVYILFFFIQVCAFRNFVVLQLRILI